SPSLRSLHAALPISHIAFRPVMELEVLLRRMDVDPFTGFVTRSEFKADDRGFEDAGATRVLTDGSTPILLFADLLGPTGKEAIEDRKSTRLNSSHVK